MKLLPESLREIVPNGTPHSLDPQWKAYQWLVVTDVADRYRVFSGGLKKGHPELKVCSRVYLLDAEGRHKKPEIYEVEYTTLRQAAVDHIRIAWTCLHAESLQELPNLLRMTEARGTQSGTTGE